MRAITHPMSEDALRKWIADGTWYDFMLIIRYIGNEMKQQGIAHDQVVTDAVDALDQGWLADR